MTFLDFFSGVGGFRIGMEKAGHECVGFCEYDKHAVRSYKAMHMLTQEEQKELLSLGNLKAGRKYIDQIPEREWYANDITRLRAIDIPRADCWCFGFPCQDISVAGKQDGFKGQRSSLFFAVTGYLRQLPEEARPSYLIIENVKNFLSVNGGYDFLKAQIELDEIGYDAEWCLVNSTDVIPQNRERVFIVCYFRGRRTRKVFPIGRSNETAAQLQGQSVNCIKSTYAKSMQTGSHVAECEQPKQVIQIGNVCPTATRSNPNQGRVYDPNVIAPCLNKMEGGNHQPCIPFDGRIRKLTPLECFRLQTVPDELFYLAQAVNSDSQLYKQAGNMVTCDVIYEIGKRMEVLQ